jgi:hypothetical protein
MKTSLVTTNFFVSSNGCSWSMTALCRIFRKFYSELLQSAAIPNLLFRFFLSVSVALMNPMKRQSEIGRLLLHSSVIYLNLIYTRLYVLCVCVCVSPLSSLFLSRLSHPRVYPVSPLLSSLRLELLGCTTYHCIALVPSCAQAACNNGDAFEGSNHPHASPNQAHPQSNSNTHNAPPNKQIIY